VVAFLHGGSPFKVWQPDSFRIRLNRRSTFNYGWDILLFVEVCFSDEQGLTPELLFIPSQPIMLKQSRRIESLFLIGEESYHF
jgi:hypothetical protein